MGRWNTLDLLFISLNYNVTLVGKIWLTLMIMLRILILLFAGYPLYHDEQERFICNTIQPGCANVCYNVFAPVSHCRFWLVQMVILCLPHVIFIVYVIHKVSTRLSLENNSSNKLKTLSLRKIHQETFRKASLIKTALEAERGKIPSFSGAYVFQLLLRILFEAGFGAGQYYLFGFFIPKRYLCYESPCTSMVDCYISRPTEKTVLINFMFGVSAISFLLNIADLICVIKRSMRQSRKNKLLMERMYEEEQYYLTPPSRNVDSQLEMTEGYAALDALNKRRGSDSSADSAASIQLDEGVENLPAHSEALSSHVAYANHNNAYTQAQEEPLEQEGSETSLCLTESKVAPGKPGRYCRRARLRAQPSRLGEKAHAGEADSTSTVHTRRIGRYTLVEMSSSAGQSSCSEMRDKRSEWV
ncbi:gap junction delta-4 protein-like [Huso huso]|uniref:Gap junction protein n=1 Tax=Huso huso TaxID=61971 RepID=A0ABR1A572_HUSHU